MWQQVQINGWDRRSIVSNARLFSFVVFCDGTFRLTWCAFRLLFSLFLFVGFSCWSFRFSPLLNLCAVCCWFFFHLHFISLLCSFWTWVCVLWHCYVAHKIRTQNDDYEIDHLLCAQFICDRELQSCLFRKKKTKNM